MARHKIVTENDPFILLFYPLSQASCYFEEVIFLGHDNIRMERKKIRGGGDGRLSYTRSNSTLHRPLWWLTNPCCRSWMLLPEPEHLLLFLLLPDSATPLLLLMPKDIPAQILDTQENLHKKPNTGQGWHFQLPNFLVFMTVLFLKNNSKKHSCPEHAMIYRRLVSCQTWLL